MIPYSVERRGDTGVTNVTMGIWLFLASEAMLFGSMFSAYALLRVGAAAWGPAPFTLDIPLALANTAVLIAATAAAWRARTGAHTGARRWLLAVSVLACVFLALKYVEDTGAVARGMAPSVSTFVAMYFTLTGLHALHVAGGAAASLWAWASAKHADIRLTAGRLRALALYWTFVDVVWLLILALVYFA